LPEFKMAYPETNKVLLFTTIGQDLEVVEKEIPPLPANEILVKVHAASINPVDIQLWRSGLVGVVASTKGMGRDFSGTVVAVGSSVRGWADHDDIFGLLFHVVCLQSWFLRSSLLRMLVWSRHFQPIYQYQPSFRSSCQETELLDP
jgi:Alcohol dehydrogenase GroES-like domain